MGYFKILAAIPGFFSEFFFPDAAVGFHCSRILESRPISYVKAIVNYHYDLDYRGSPGSRKWTRKSSLQINVLWGGWVVGVVVSLLAGASPCKEAVFFSWARQRKCIGFGNDANNRRT